MFLHSRQSWLPRPWRNRACQPFGDCAREKDIGGMAGVIVLGGASCARMVRSLLLYALVVVAAAAFPAAQKQDPAVDDVLRAVARYRYELANRKRLTEAAFRTGTRRRCAARWSTC